MYDFIPAYEIILHIMYLYVNIAAFNPIHASGSFFYPLKTSENKRFFDVSRGPRKRPVAWNGLMRNMVFYVGISSSSISLHVLIYDLIKSIIVTYVEI